SCPRRAAGRSTRRAPPPRGRRRDGRRCARRTAATPRARARRAAPRAAPRGRRRVRARAAADLAARLEGLLGERGLAASPRFVERIVARRDGDREVVVPVESIDLLRAEGNYVRLFTAKGELVRRATLQALAAQLDPARFLRINRSEVVRLDAVAELQPWFHGDYRVLLRDGTRVTWSRRFRREGRVEGTLL